MKLKHIFAFLFGALTASSWWASAMFRNLAGMEFLWALPIVLTIICGVFFVVSVAEEKP